MPVPAIVYGERLSGPLVGANSAKERWLGVRAFRKSIKNKSASIIDSVVLVLVLLYDRSIV